MDRIGNAWLSRPNEPQPWMRSGSHAISAVGRLAASTTPGLTHTVQCRLTSKDRVKEQEPCSFSSLPHHPKPSRWQPPSGSSDSYLINTSAEPKTHPHHPPLSPELASPGGVPPAVTDPSSPTSVSPLMYPSSHASMVSAHSGSWSQPGQSNCVLDAPDVLVRMLEPWEPRLHVGR